MKKNLILLIIAGILVGLYFLDQKREEQKQAQEDKEKQISALKPEEVKEVVINAQGVTVHAVKDGDQWKLTEPVQAAADKAALDNIVSTFAGGKSQRVIETNPADPAKFGLDKSTTQVTLIGAEPSQTATIVFGKTTPTAGKNYALIKDSSEVITLFSTALSSVDKKPYDFRDKTVLKLVADEVQKVEIAHANLKATVQRQGKDWVITEPIQARADGSKIEEWVTQINGAQVKQFIEENPNTLDAFGLVEPATKTVFWTGTPADASSWASKALLLGSTNESQYVYAKRDGQSNVFAVNPPDFNKTPRTLDEIRMQKVTPLRSWEINQVKLTSPAVVMEASKEQGEWVLRQPKQGKADFNSVSELTRSVVELQIAKYVQATTEDLQLGQPVLSVEMNSETGSDAFTLAPGPAGEDGTPYYYGVKKNPLEIFAVKTEPVDAIIRGASDVKIETPPPAPAPEPDAAQ